MPGVRPDYVALIHLNFLSVHRVVGKDPLTKVSQMASDHYWGQSSLFNRKSTSYCIHEKFIMLCIKRPKAVLPAFVCVDETVFLFILTMEGGKRSRDHTPINGVKSWQMAP